MLMGGKLPPECTPVEIMRWMHWSWEDYLATPEHIVDIVVAMMNADRRAAEQRQRDQGADARMAGRQAKHGFR